MGLGTIIKKSAAEMVVEAFGLKAIVDTISAKAIVDTIGAKAILDSLSKKTILDSIDLQRFVDAIPRSKLGLFIESIEKRKRQCSSEAGVGCHHDSKILRR